MRGSPDYELRQRTRNLNMLFDRRGDVAYWDDFESPTAKGAYWASGAGTAARVNTYAKFGDNSLQCTTGAMLNDDAGIVYRFTDYVEENIGSSISFMTADAGWYVFLVIDNYLPAERHTAILRIRDDGVIHIYEGTPGVYTQIQPNAPYRASLRNWATLKLVIDIATNRYVRAVIFGREYDLSMYELEGGLAGGVRHIMESIHLRTRLGGVKTAYMDDFQLTRNE